MRKQAVLFLLGIFISGVSTAQSQLTLYQLNSRLPQANQINPGLFPEYKLTIGLPVLSSTYVSGSTGKLSFNNSFTRSADDSLHFNPQKLSESLNEKNRIDVNSNSQLFYLGLKVKKNYFSLSLNERIEAGITYPKTFVQLLAAGNGAYVNQLLAFDGLGLRAQAYHELALGYGRDINEKLSIGIRGKYLSGVAGLDIDNIDAALLTTTDSIYLRSSAFNVNMAGYDLLDGTTNIFKAATGLNNTGFAFDIGAHYWITDKLRVSLAVNDIGAINWDDNTRQLRFDEVNYSFTGIDFISAIDPNNNSDLLSQELDSLRGLYRPDTVEGIKYKTRLTTKIYAGGSYHLGKHHTFGALFYGDFFKGTFNPAFGLSYNLELGQIWTIGVNVSYRNGTINNFGVGTTLTLGPIQLYALTENIATVANFGDASLFDARVGLNLVFGKMNKKPKKNREAKTNPVPVIPAAPLVVLSEPVTEVLQGNAADELNIGFYVVIASFNSKEESEAYNQRIHEEGYAVLSGFQSEKAQYFTYLMYFPDDGNKAIEKKNDMTKSLPPGLEKPWVMWVKEVK